MLMIAVENEKNLRAGSPFGSPGSPPHSNSAWDDTLLFRVPSISILVKILGAHSGISSLHLTNVSHVCRFGERPSQSEESPSVSRGWHVPGGLGAP